MRNFQHGQPPEGEVLIVEKGNLLEQCEIKGNTAYLWRYEGRTETPFCLVREITGWRKCSGLDF